MKRILSLTLLAAMLLSTLALTSCNEVLGTVGNFAGNLLNGVVNIFNPQPQYRTEITEAEWHKAALNSNFTITAADTDQKLTLVVDGLLIKADLDYGMYKIDLVCDLENCLLIGDTSVGRLATKTDLISSEVPELTLDSIGYFPLVEFSELVYDAEKGAYTYSTDYMNYEYFFRDGVLYEGKTTYTYSDGEEGTTVVINNVGTSVVEIGEYTLINDGKVEPSKAHENVRTAITNADLAAHLNMRNFTINAATMSMYIGVDLSLKVADTGVELLVSAMGETLQSQYLALIENELYSIEEYGDEHLATPIGANMDEVNEAIQMAKEYMSTEYLVYNEEGRYYTLEVEGYAFYFYFENGRLVKGVLVVNQSILGGATSPAAEDSDDAEYLEIIFVVSDIGKTTVTLPEYIIDDDSVIYD